MDWRVHATLLTFNAHRHNQIKDASSSPSFFISREKTWPKKIQKKQKTKNKKCQKVTKRRAQSTAAAKGVSVGCVSHLARIMASSDVMIIDDDDDDGNDDEYCEMLDSEEEAEAEKVQAKAKVLAPFSPNGKKVTTVDGKYYFTSAKALREAWQGADFYNRY